MNTANLHIPSVYFGPFFAEVFRLFRKYRITSKRARITAMNRIHIALNTNRFEESIEFYSKLFGQQPAKRRENWAKFDLADPALNLTLNRDDKTAHHGHINHMGVEPWPPWTSACNNSAWKQYPRKTPPVAMPCRTRPG